MAEDFLRPYQRDAVRRMFSGCILNGGVGSGKSRTGLYWYFQENGGSIIGDEYKEMFHPKDLYIITTPFKRDRHEWDGELLNYYISTNPETSYYNNKVVVDSWNNIKKYASVKNAYFIFDEDKLSGYGAWAHAFIEISKNNKWIVLSATPGDVWMDYMTIFIANGYYKHKTDFCNQHVVWNPHVSYQSVQRYINVERLVRLKKRTLIDMDFHRSTIPHHEDVWVDYDKSIYKQVLETRWNPYKDEPIKQAAELCSVLRQIVNSSEDRQQRILEIMEDHPKVIIFYNYNYERRILLDMIYPEGTEVAEWSGFAHQPLPTGDKWVYLVQYTAGAEGWNAITTDTIIFYSQNYSYKATVQAAGRIDRLNTPYVHLYYYHIKSKAGIDLAISRALKEKKLFNEMKFAKEYFKE